MEQSSPLSLVKQILLEQRLKGDARKRLIPGVIPARPDRDSAPLSFTQRQMWLIDQMTPGNPAYNLPYGYRLRGRLDLAALEQAFNQVIRRHETLRTAFTAENDEPQQIIHPDLKIKINFTGLDHLPHEQRESAAQTLASEESAKPFDLTRLPLIRVSVLKLNNTEHILIIKLHHIIADGLSIGLLVNELDAFYRAITQRTDPSLPKLLVQYGDFAHWHRQISADEAAYRKQIDFWKKELSGRLPVLELPGDKPRPVRQSFNGSNVFFEIPATLAPDLKALAARHNSTFFTTVLAAFEVLLHRYSGAEDIIIGTPVTARTPGDLEPLIGLFLKMVALRCDISGDPTFTELLQRSRETTLNAFSNSDLPLELLMKYLKFERDLSRNPVFQVALQVMSPSPPRIG